MRVSPEEFGHRAPIMDTTDGSREEFCYGEDRHIRQFFLVGERNGVCHHDFFNGCVFEAFESGTGEDAMRGAAVDVAHTMLVYEAYGLCERTSSVDFVVDDQGLPSFAGADDPQGCRYAMVAR